MNKRGQVTVFIIVGIILLFLFAGILYVTSLIKKDSLEIQEALPLLETLQPRVNLFMESCIIQIAEPSVYLLGVQGGVIYPEEDSTILLTDYGMINYAWLNGEQGLSKKKMERDLATYLEDNIKYCVGEFESFTQQDIIIEPNYDKIKAEADIKDFDITFYLEFPLTIIIPDGKEIQMSDFSNELRMPLGKMINTAETLSSSSIDPLNLVDLPYKSSIFPFDESTVIYSLADETVLEAPLALMFAVRNDIPENEPPILNFVPDQTFRVGDRWKEVFTAKDLGRLTFSSDSNRFPVSEEGRINKVFNQEGTFRFKLKVEDEGDLIDEQDITVVVLPAYEDAEILPELEEITISDAELEAIDDEGR